MLLLHHLRPIFVTSSYPLRTLFVPREGPGPRGRGRNFDFFLFFQNGFKRAPRALGGPGGHWVLIFHLFWGLFWAFWGPWGPWVPLFFPSWAWKAPIASRARGEESKSRSRRDHGEKSTKSRCHSTAAAQTSVNCTRGAPHSAAQHSSPRRKK